MLTAALFYMTNFDLQIDFKTAALARIIQGTGLACLFVPINTVAYSYLPPGKNNAASGLINLARNVGGSVGISFVTTMLDRRAQFHRSQLSAHLDPANPSVQQMLHGASGALQTQSGMAATKQSYELLQRMVERQSTMLSYLDNFHVLAIVTMAMIPFVFVIRKPKRRGDTPVH
jgi:DHA2 family multidrug resistance protein